VAGAPPWSIHINGLRHLVSNFGALRDPFEGIGKPGPLKYLGPDVWSRRITQEHQCVCLVKADRVEFLQGRYHY
jgi:Txe/YoeB family toxin of toxin-antitoxin system